MAPRQIKTTELVERAAEHSDLSPAQASEAVDAVFDAIGELGGEVEGVELINENGGEGGIVVKMAPQLDPANPPEIDLQAAAIPDEGMIGSSLFSSRRGFSGARRGLFRSR